MGLSGITAGQVRAFLVGYRNTPLPGPILTVTANNLSLTLRELLIELLKEHEAMNQGR